MANTNTGNIIHVELPARDEEAAAAFYSSLFGWRTIHSPNYVGFRTADGPSGGFNPLTEENASTNTPIKPGDVLVYVSSDDIDATLGNVQALGGSVVVPRTEIPGAGWFAIFADPTGNRIGLLHFTQEWGGES
jgi:predicted enzyme related to lactoylglutathione lyase